jgi:hypothetical protein
MLSICRLITGDTKLMQERLKMLYQVKLSRRDLAREFPSVMVQKISSSCLRKDEKMTIEA